MSLYLKDPDVELHLGDALAVLCELPDESVDAIVTSPPYADARLDYDHKSAHEYGDWSAEWLREAFRVVGPAGGLMLNLGRLHRDGEELDYWIDVLARARRIGWKWLDTIVWHKLNGKGHHHYLMDRHEYVLWLGRSVDSYRGYDEARQPYAESSVGRYSRRFTAAFKLVPQERDGKTLHPDGALPGSVFACAVGSYRGLDHPAPMPEDLAAHLVRLACPSGGTVLDPFGGSGTTAVAARRLNRRSILIDSHEPYCAMAARRLAQQSLFATEGAA